VSSSVTVIAGMAAVTIAIKAAGPIALGGRALPAWFSSVVALLAPALFAALVVTACLADGQRLVVGADTAGIAAAGLVYWRTRSIVACVFVAAAATAALRAIV